MSALPKSFTTLFSLFLIGFISVGLQKYTLRRWPFKLDFAEDKFVCEAPPYNARIASYDPLIIHLENFITKAEREHLVQVANPLFERSLVSTNDEHGTVSSGRTSFTAFIPQNDSIALCVLNRAAEFQGFIPLDRFEVLQVVRYEQGQEFQAHHDWGFSSNERETSFFGILEDDCSDCGTQFPGLAVDWTEEDMRWCNLVDCRENETLVFNAIAGSAVFWKNLHTNGTGDHRTLHAGMPVRNGTKFGLNIWTHSDTFDDFEEPILEEQDL